jgi:hypothetical protein
MASLHDRVAAALDRAAEAQEHSQRLIERQEVVAAGARETVRHLQQRRATYGNGHRGARGRSRPG